MGLKLYPESDIENIASAVRTKFNTNSSFTVTEMSQFLSSASIGGGDYVSKYLDQVSVLSVPSVSRVPTYRFYGNSVLTEVTFDNCFYIYSSAFISCSSLVSANFPICITVYNGAFAFCTSLENISLPNCTSIVSNNFYMPFASCSALRTISLPKISQIASSLFTYLSLSSVYLSICDKIYNSAFQSNYYLNLISAPSCSSVYQYAFRSCNSIASIDLPALNYIGSYAFAYCTQLNTFKMGSGRTTGATSSFISQYAFRGCWNLLSFYVLTPYVTGLSNVNVFASTPISTYTTSTGGVRGTIYVPASLLATYKTATNWLNYSDIMVGI